VFYIVMDIAIHWGILRYIRKEIGANPIILITALVLDVVVLAAFLLVKAKSDPLILYVSLVGMAIIFASEAVFLRWKNES
ncbi:MAG: amino acid permease, partial [Candidatus Omnitrophica bacterium]|nr:amino acid permease [Candidatus Omnitrophota bacterium]